MRRQRSSGRDRGNRPFAWLWWSQTVSGFGSQVTLIAIPLLAATTLKASAFEMGLLAAVETLPYIFFSIPAGALVDRADRRFLLLVTSLGRATILMGIPAAALFSLMSLPVLYGVAFVLGTLSVVSDVAHQSYVPDLLEPDELLTGNQRLELSESAARTIGPGIGGALVGLFGGAVAVIVDALSYLVACLLLLRSRPPRRVRATADAEPPEQPAHGGPPAPGEPVAMIVDVWDYVARLESRVADLERRMAGRSLRVRATGALTGFGIVRRDRVLRDMAASTATFNLASSSVIAIFVLYAATEAKLDAAAIGWLMAAGNIGFVLGAIPVGAITRRLGVGPTLVISCLLGATALVILPFAVGAAAVPLLFAGRFIGAFSIPLYNVNTRALRQSRAPREALGRVNAVFRLLDWGTVPIGALLGGGIGSLFGLRAALAVAAVFGVASALVLLFSPLRRLQELDGTTAGSEAGSPAAASGLSPALRRFGTRAMTALTRMPSIRWWGLAIGGALAQVILFLPPVNARLGDAAPWIYFISSVSVLACVVRNARVPGLAFAAAGGACNLLAIVANGGAMPVSPEAARLVGHTLATSYTNTVELADPTLKLLTDIIAVPSPLPFSNVYSVGDLLIIAGVLVTMAWAVHGSVARLKPAEAALASA